jgi:tetrahydromethanopterin S-methyltransferase subunit G
MSGNCYISPYIFLAALNKFCNSTHCKESEALKTFESKIGRDIGINLLP